MIPEGPFLSAVGAVNLSLAGLAGLVATLRRDSSGEFSALDRFRLREIVEFSFANALFALALVPMSGTLGSTEEAVRVLSGAVIAYQVVFVTILLHRQTTRGLPFTRGWAAFIGAVNLAIAIAAIAGLVWGSVGAYEWLLLLMLVRPMIAFVTVLTSFERPTTGISGD